MKKIIMATGVAMMLAGCDSANVVTHKEEGKFTLRYEQSAFYHSGLTLKKLNDGAGEACPSGWKKLEEKVEFDTNEWGTHVWQIVCL